jgi:hypothetical protein
MYDAGELASRQERLKALRADLDDRLDALKGYDQSFAGGTADTAKAFTDVKEIRRLRENVGMFSFAPQMANALHALNQKEDAFRDTAIARVDQMGAMAHDGGNAKVASYLSDASAIMKEIAAQEKVVRDGLREAGREFMLRGNALTAPNMITGQMKDSNAAENLQPVRDQIAEERASETAAAKREGRPDFYANPLHEDALRAVIAEEYGLGQCGEKSALNSSLAQHALPGTLVMKMAHSVNHTAVFLGPIGYPESAVLDSLPEKATVTTWKNYGLVSMSRQPVRNERIADGTDLMAQVRARVDARRAEDKRLPRVLTQGVPMTREDAERRQFERGVQRGTWDFTHTSAVANSDSSASSSPREGTVISDGAFMSTLATGYQQRGPRHNDYESYVKAKDAGSASQSNAPRR